MPVEFIDRFKEVDLAVEDLELEARTNEGFIIREVEAESSVIGASARIIIQDTTMLNIAIHDTNIGLIPLINRNVATLSFFKYMRKQYSDVPLLRVTEGEKFVITSGGIAGKARIRYVQVTGGEIPKPTDDGGSLAKNKLFVSTSHKNFSVGIGLTEIFEFDESKNPAGMFDFPFGEVAPANYVFELLGFALGFANKGANITIDGMRLWHIDQSILARDEAFVNIESFPYLPNTKDNRLHLMSAKEIISAGDELKVEVRLANAGVGVETVDMYCTMIFLQKKV